MKTLLLNREFKMPADGWFQVVPLGEFPISVSREQYAAFKNAGAAPAGARLRVVQVVDAEACADMVAAFNRAAAVAGDIFAGLPIDYDHFSNDTTRSSEAAGWISQLQQRADGVYGLIRWAGDGEAKVASGAYRYLSPVFNVADCAMLAADRVRPLRLAEAALTNKPNMRTIRPLTNRDEELEGSFEQKDAKNAKEEVQNSQKKLGNRSGDPDRKGEAMREKIVAMLKLAADASDEAVLDAMQTLANRAAGVEQTNVQLASECQALKNRVAEFERAALEAKVEGDLEKFKDRIANRDQMKAALLANREETLKVLEAIGAPAAGVRLLNRADGKAPEIVSEEQKLANRRNEREAYLDQVQHETRCRTRAEAYELAQRKNPDLFK